MTTTRDVGETLATYAQRPESEWPALVAKLPEELRTQALIWLRANRERVDDDEATPALEGDRYELGVLLDVGATASVWQAHDAKLGRNVAIKVFRGERSPVLDEILAEARAAAEITSDHVVRVLDVHDADPPYIVMELVGEWEPKRGVLAPGGSAAAIRPRSEDEAVRWVRDVARGVHDAHLRNVFHRDLKPHNVLITPFSRRARIADFGLAVSEGSDTSGTIDADRDRALQIAGTPGYIAPEQASGLPQTLDPHDLDERAVLVALDVWGLGALAFDLLADRPPWQADDGLEPWELAASATEAPELPRSLPRALRRILRKALAIEPRQRYATAGELADDLDAYLAREPTSLDSSRIARFWLWCRRNPQLTITVGLATILAAISGATYMQIVEVRAQRNALVLESDTEAQRIVDLQQRGATLRADLATTDHDLTAKNAELEQVKQTLTDADTEYKAVVEANERALADASAATRALADQLAQARTERDTAKFGRKLYEDFWNRARAESEQADRDRDQAQHDRDEAHDERDKALEERDAAVDARSQVEQERDRALADRDRAEAIRRRIEGDLAKVTAQLAALKGLPATPAKPGATPAVQARAPAAGSAAPAPKPPVAGGSATAAPLLKPAVATGSAAPTLSIGSDATATP
ncbi:MAG TPA: protein kinase [Kofleriaceae bacterium]